MYLPFDDLTFKQSGLKNRSLLMKRNEKQVHFEDTCPFLIHFVTIADKGDEQV